MGYTFFTSHLILGRQKHVQVTLQGITMPHDDEKIVVLRGMHKAVQKTGSLVEDYLKSISRNITRIHWVTDKAPQQKEFCIMAFVWCENKTLAYAAYKEIDSAISSGDMQQLCSIRSPYLSVNLKTSKSKFSSDQTLILKGIHNDFRDQHRWVEIEKILNASTSYVLNIKSMVDKYPEHTDFATMAYLNYENSTVVRHAKHVIDDEIAVLKTRKDPIYSIYLKSFVNLPPCDFSSPSSKDLGSPMDFLRQLKAHSSIELLFTKMHVQGS